MTVAPYMGMGMGMGVTTRRLAACIVPHNPHIAHGDSKIAGDDR